MNSVSDLIKLLKDENVPEAEVEKIIEALIKTATVSALAEMAEAVEKSGKPDLPDNTDPAVAEAKLREIYETTTRKKVDDLVKEQMDILAQKVINKRKEQKLGNS